MAKRKIKSSKKKDEKEFVLPEFETEETAQSTNSEQPEFVKNAIEQQDIVIKNEAETELDKMLGDFESPLPDDDLPIITEEKGKRGRKKKEAEKADILIPGELMIGVLDNITSGGMSLLDKWISKNPLPIEAFSLNEKQAEKLAPMAERALAYWQVQTNPGTAFIITYLSMTISNYVLLKAVQKNNPEAFNPEKK